jgi:hypothetical protein
LAFRSFKKGSLRPAYSNFYKQAVAIIDSKYSFNTLCFLQMPLPKMMTNLFA